jgi:uncharacterized membrane protein
MLRGTHLAIMMLFLLAWATSVPAILGQGDSEESQRMILNVYMDRTGKALVTGYVENPKELHFLNASQYSYENETNQIYALTNALTKKDGDIWKLIFESLGYYEDYHLTFYLPSNVKVKNLSSSQEVEYLLSISNDSMVVEFQGYDVKDPVTSIEYQQLLESSAPQTYNITYLLALILILASGAAAAFWWRDRTKRSQVASRSTTGIENSAHSLEDLQSYEKSASFESEKSDDEKDAMPEVKTQPLSSLGEKTLISRELNTSNESLNQEKQDLMDAEKLSFESVELEEESMGKPESCAPIEKIKVSSEMAAIMETLTPRERAILQALIERGGRTTQADLRYETHTPKSSLTGIINSLERRKLVTKKEWGRTNVIELSEWFLSKKERS